MTNEHLAILLHHYPYQETSLLLKLFTEEAGLISVIAKGARAKARQSHYLLQPFTCYRMQLAGTGQIKNLRQYDSQEAFHLTKTALWSGYYCNELLLKLLPAAEPIPELFRDYRETIRMLSQYPEAAAAILRHFESSLLQALGLLPNLLQDALGRLVKAESFYQISIDMQIQPVTNPIPSDAIPGKFLIAVAKRHWQDPKVLEAAKNLFRQLLEIALDGRILQTPQIYRQVMKK